MVNPQKKQEVVRYFQIYFNGMLLLFLLSVPTLGVSGTSNTMTNSFSFRDMPFKEVVEILSNQYNVEISYDKALAKHPVSGEYFDVSLEEMLKRILKGKSISIITHSKNNVLDIRLFGEKNQRLVASPDFQSRSKFTNSVDPFTQKTVAELNTILEQQESNKKARLENPNYVDPFSGVRQSELNNILQLQEKNKEQRLGDPRFIDPMTGKTYSELASIKKEQEASRDSRLSKENSLDSFTGKKISDLNLIYRKQEENKTKRLNDPNSIDPFTGQTISALNNILKIQEENKKARLGD